MRIGKKTHFEQAGGSAKIVAGQAQDAQAFALGAAIMIAGDGDHLLQDAGSEKPAILDGNRMSPHFRTLHGGRGVAIEMQRNKSGGRMGPGNGCTFGQSQIYIGIAGQEDGMPGAGKRTEYPKRQIESDILLQRTNWTMRIVGAGIPDSRAAAMSGVDYYRCHCGRD